jgi:hypothetical protein
MLLCRVALLLAGSVATAAAKRRTVRRVCIPKIDPNRDMWDIFGISLGLPYVHRPVGNHRTATPRRFDQVTMDFRGQQDCEHLYQIIIVLFAVRAHIAQLL